MRILVGYDGPDTNEKILKLAKIHANGEKSEIEVVHCMTQGRKLAYEDIRKVERHLEREARKILNSGKIPYQTHVVVTDQESGEALVQFAEQTKVDEIIIGIRKKSKTRKFLFGSTAQYLILNAPCPVVSVK